MIDVGVEGLSIELVEGGGPIDSRGWSPGRL